mmetsp:Transcript_1976/g.7437  ORF Transcript_1976/g.7437 Transcript_1976/m.7437 type:complete len:323 (-) Transcript_1976:90-1058(-)
MRARAGGDGDRRRGRGGAPDDQDRRDPSGEGADPEAGAAVRRRLGGRRRGGVHQAGHPPGPDPVGEDGQRGQHRGDGGVPPPRRASQGEPAGEIADGSQTGRARHGSAQGQDGDHRGVGTHWQGGGQTPARVWVQTSGGAQVGVAQGGVGLSPLRRGSQAAGRAQVDQKLRRRRPVLQPDQGEHGHDKRRLHRTHETGGGAGEHRQGRFVQQGTRPPGARRRKAGVPGVRRGVAGAGGPDGPAGGARTRVLYPARGGCDGHVLPDDGRHRGQSVRVAAGGPVDGGDVRRGHQPRAQVHGGRDHDRQREPSGVSGHHRAVRRL